MSADVRLGFRLGPWKIEPPIGTVTGPDGDTTHLEPKVMDVLTCLARHPNELVSREQLLDSVWNGQSASDELLTRAISGLRHALHDARSDPKYIETIPKRGYRLLGDIQTVDRLDFESSGDDDKLASAHAKRKWTYAGAGLVALTLAIFVFDQYLPDATRQPSSSSEESSVTVGNTYASRNP